MLNGEGDCLAPVLQMVIVGHHYLNALMPVTSIPLSAGGCHVFLHKWSHFPGSSYAHDRIFAGDTHAAQHLAGVAANIGGDLAGIAFGHAYLRCGVTLPSFINTPSLQFNSCALVISVIISASFFCWSWKPDRFCRTGSFLCCIAVPYDNSPWQRRSHPRQCRSVLW